MEIESKIEWLKKDTGEDFYVIYNCICWKAVDIIYEIIYCKKVLELPLHSKEKPSILHSKLFTHLIIYFYKYENYKNIRPFLQANPQLDDDGVETCLIFALDKTLLHSKESKYYLKDNAKFFRYFKDEFFKNYLEAVKTWTPLPRGEVGYRGRDNH